MHVNVKQALARLAKPLPTPAGLIEPQPPRPDIAPQHPVPTPPALAPPALDYLNPGSAPQQTLSLGPSAGL